MAKRPAAAAIEPEVQKWIKAIADYEREFKRWEGRVEKILKKYRDEQRFQQDQGAQFNILWSNIQTAIPATFSRLPKPDVSRRFRDTDPVGRVAALLLERGLDFEVQHYPDYRTTMNASVFDRFLGGRGTSWVRYEPHFKALAAGAPLQGSQVTEDADESATTEQLDYECSPTDYVHWKDFGHTIARSWEEVTGVWRKVYMERPALIERFGRELGEKIPLDTKPDKPDKQMMGGEEATQALIIEIWDKTTMTAKWLSKSLGRFVDEQPDPLGLDGFWPCPRPLYATLTTDSLVPVPDYTIYQDQAKTLDTLADRIDGLVKMLQVKGCYDAATPELARIFTEGENGVLMPVKNWSAYAEKQGLKGTVDVLDLKPIFEALETCYESAQLQKDQIYELTGLADVIRGQSDPRETAEAVKTKGQFGSMRLRSMQHEVGCYATQLLQIKGQIIARMYSEQTIRQIGGADQLSIEDQALVPQAIALLKNATLRDFRIEIVADSMIYMDEQQEKADRMEMLQAVGAYLKEAVAAAQSSPELAPLLMEMLKFGVTGFRVGKTLEGTFEAVAEKVKAAAANPQPRPDPEMAKVQTQAQLEHAKIQMQDQQHQRELIADAQMEQFKANLAAQVEQAKQQAQLADAAHQQELEAARDQQKAALEAQLKQAEAAANQAVEAAKIELEKYKADLESRTKILVAEISAQTTIQAAQLSAAKTAAEGGEIKDKPQSAPAPVVNVTVSGKRKITKRPDGNGYDVEDV